MDSETKKTDRLRSPFIIDAPHSKKADKIGLSDGELITKYANDAVILIEVRDDLQNEIDSRVERVPGTTVGITHFENWGKTRDSLLLHVKPTQVEQVVAVVKAVKVLNQRKTQKVHIGMGGAYHTWSSTYPDNMGLLVNTSNLKLDWDSTTDGYNRINLNESKSESEERTITISPGVTTGELMAFFLQHNICFESDVVLPTVTYGGVFTGACHGTGKDQPSMSDWIVSLKLVDGNGDVRSLPDDIGTVSVSPDDVLKAAQATMGVFGVITEFTVKVQPMSHCRVNNIFDSKVKDIFHTGYWHCISLNISMGDKSPIEQGELADLLQKYWSVELFWFPFNSILERILSILPSGKGAAELNISPESFFASHPKNIFRSLEESVEARNLNPLIWTPGSDYLWIRGIDIDREKTLQITQEPGIPFWSRVIDVATHTSGQYILAPMMQNLPGTTPVSLMVGFQLVKLQYGATQKEEVVRTPWAIHYRDGIDLMTVYDVEFAFPVDITNPSNVHDAVRRVIDIVQDYAYNGKFPRSKRDGDDEEIKYPLTLVLEMRVMKKSDVLLSPASIGDEEHIAYIEVLSTTGTRGYEQFFTDVSMAWIELGGVPHWQKQWEFLEKQKTSNFDIFSYLREKYGRNIETFVNVLGELRLDPDGIFMNDMMKKVLVPHENP